MKEIRTELNQLNQEEPAKLQRTNGKSATHPLELTNEKHIELSQENPHKNLKRRIQNCRNKSLISTLTTESDETSSSSSKTSRNNKLSSKFYNGMSDPINYVRHHRQTMALYEHDDALMCRVFPSSLEGPALNWYHSLPSNSIHSFIDICSTFIGQYSTHRDMKKGLDYLFTVQMWHMTSLQ
ncbi:hypothetical protein WN944_027036 [Citrus x changshan-huyou]|uniref:Retrotransposon gag domain-containing protein n=1 Tax=Citrus x changshan-huyou TaxID=2935761 RepID=A0AAP0LH65_9ROSI